MREILPSTLHPPQGDIWQCLESFLGVTAGEEVPLAMRTAKHPAMRRAGSHNKELSSAKCQYAEAEKP